MPNPITIRYDLDRTGVSPDNRVLSEPHELINRKIRPVSPKNGPFFTESVVVRDRLTNSELIPLVDWKPSELYTIATMDLGKEVHALILITNEAVSNQIEIDYQVVGGEYSYNISSIVNMINNLDLDNRPASWPSIIDKPVGFDPAPHLHDAGDTFGWEYVVQAIGRVEDAILIGDRASHDQILQYIDSLMGGIHDSLEEMDNRLTAHTNNTDNPHQTNKSHVGLGNVNNYGTANNAQTLEGTSSTLYTTPAGVMHAVNASAVNPLNSHINNTSNPHQTNKSHVGLGNVNNYGTANNTQAAAGTASNLYITPASLNYAISQNVLVPLTNHTTNTNNPHNVSKSQVGLGNVNNYATATTAQAVAGTATNLYVTPAGLLTAITEHAGALLNNHINDTNNPHQVTAGQVGAPTVSQMNTALAAKLSLTGGTMTGRLTGAQNSVSMTSGNNTANGSFVARATGTGDANLAGMTFQHNNYSIKQGVRSDGYFGIGGASSSAWRWYSDPYGNTVAVGDVTAYSDPRLKENIRIIENPLDKLSKLDGVYFNWRTDVDHVRGKEGKDDLGILADQVLDVFPEMVSESISLNNTSYLTVAYDKFAPVFIESFKIVNNKLKETEEELEEMKERLLVLEKMNY